MIRSIIVDDEQKNRETLQLMISQFCDDIEVTHLVPDIHKAKEIIETTKPQLVFLDVEMPPYSAFDLLKSLDNIDFEIIFVTAFNYYAIEAIKFSALDYILKPVKVDELKEGINRARKKLSQTTDQSIESKAEKLDVLFQNPDNLERIIINSLAESHVIELNQISHIESDNSYSKITKTSKETILSSKPIIEYDKLLENRNFYRIHKCHLINLSQINMVLKGDQLGVEMNTGELLPLSRRRRDDFLNRIAKK